MTAADVWFASGELPTGRGPFPERGRQPRPPGAVWRPTRGTFVYPVPASTPAVCADLEALTLADPYTRPAGDLVRADEVAVGTRCYLFDATRSAWWLADRIRFTRPDE